MVTLSSSGRDGQNRELRRCFGVGSSMSIADNFKNCSTVKVMLMLHSTGCFGDSEI